MAEAYEVEVPTAGLDDEDLKSDITLEEEDDVLCKKVALRLKEGQKMHNKVCKKAKDNMALFEGDIEKVMRTGQASQYNSKALKNVLFLTIRNLVGLSTDVTPIPDVMPAKETPQSQKKARIVASSLENDMVRTKFQDILALNLFDTWIKGDSYLHWFWNYATNDNDVVSVKIEELTIADGSTTLQDSEFTIYHPWKNRTWWKKNFPDFYDKIKFESVSKDGKIESGSGGRGSSARFISYWENDVRVEQVMGKEGDWLLLKKGKNPYYEYRSTDEQIMIWAGEMYPQVAQLAEWAGVTNEDGIRMMIQDPELNPEATTGEMEEFTPIINFLAESQKPFVQIPSIRLLGDLYSKDIISQVKEAFLDLNMKKRMTADNLRGCNTKLVVDSNSFTEEEAATITDEPLQVLRVDFQQNPKPVYFAETTNFPLDKVLADMADDQQYIDDVFGHHEISRGAGKANTLGQDQMNFESDKTPIRFQVRAVENAIVELWQGWIQLKKMFYTDAHYIKKQGATDGMEVLKLMSQDIEEGIDPILQPMSTAPMSKMVRAQQSMELAAGGLLDPYTMFTDLGRNDPVALTNRLVNWINFKIISAEDPMEVMADIQAGGSGAGDGTENPIEVADQENRAMQNGEDIPPTAPQLVTKEHVKLHFAFLNDPKNKMEEEAMDTLRNHALADKATLMELMKQGLLDEAGNQITQERTAATQPAPGPAQTEEAAPAAPPM